MSHTPVKKITLTPEVKALFYECLTNKSGLDPSQNKLVSLLIAQQFPSLKADIQLQSDKPKKPLTTFPKDKAFRMFVNVLCWVAIVLGVLVFFLSVVS